MMDKRTQKTITHSHRHQHDGQEHTHQHASNPDQESHTHEHEHPVIIYPDERGYTIIEDKNKAANRLKELDMTDLKLWKKDEVD